MKLSIKPEKRSKAFKKHHVHGLPFEASFNEFTAVDEGDPHDHPFDFITHILSGGYTERIYKICFYRFIDGKAYQRLWKKHKFIPVQTNK